jgi:hypothetical protein
VQAEGGPGACANTGEDVPAARMIQAATPIGSAARRKSGIRVLYLFSGAPRKCSVADAFRELCSGACPAISVDFVEIDILQNPEEHDLRDNEKRQAILEDIARGLYDIVICSPPCNTWTRAVWGNRVGPKPVRSKAYPRGFPWLEAAGRQKAETGTTLALFGVASMRAVSSACLSGHRVLGLLEHPEDLGAAKNGVPACIWQLLETLELKKSRL